MYLMVIHVPIYVDQVGGAGATFVTTEWKRSLELLRDSFDGRFGTMVVVAPSLPREGGGAEQVLERCEESADGIRLVPSIDARCRAREFWLRDRKRWMADVRREAEREGVQIAHCHIEDPVRPISGTGMKVCVRAGLPTLFVEDTDIVLQIRELAAGLPAAARMKLRTRAWLHGRAIRWGVGHADASFLKGRTLMQRYAQYSRDVRCFHDTSHREAEVIRSEALERRLSGLAARPAVRLVYCGRLLDRKGVRESVELVALANQTAGARVCELDIIGDGPEAAAVRGEISARGLAGGDGRPPVVRMLGSLPYGPELLARLGEYDGVLFTPRAEDTPRMIFDGYAAGLPLLAFDIEYVKERSDEEKATVLLDRRDLPKAASQLAAACAMGARGQLADRSRLAREAGIYHASDRWYVRRAEWTVEMVERVKQERGAAGRAR